MGARPPWSGRLRRLAQFLAGGACGIPRQQFVDAVDRVPPMRSSTVRRYASGSRPFSLAVPIRLQNSWSADLPIQGEFSVSSGGRPKQRVNVEPELPGESCHSLFTRPIVRLRVEFRVANAARGLSIRPSILPVAVVKGADREDETIDNSTCFSYEILLLRLPTDTRELFPLGPTNDHFLAVELLDENVLRGDHVKRDVRVSEWIISFNDWTFVRVLIKRARD